MDAVVDPGRDERWDCVAHDARNRTVEIACRALGAAAAVLYDAQGEPQAVCGDEQLADGLSILCAAAAAAGHVASSRSGPHVALAAPIRAGSDLVLGVLGVVRRDEIEWRGADEDLLVAIAASFGDVVEAALRTRRIEEEASRAAAAVDVNHELRTPLQAIVGFTEFLKTETRPHLIAAHARTIQAAANAVLTIINQTLDQADAEVSGSARTAVALRPFAETCLSMVGPAAIEKRLTSYLAVEDGLPSNVLLDQQKVMQALLNLLNNAVKFTDDGGYTLEIRRAGEGLRFAVTDTGIGIAEEERDRLFQRFSRVGSDDRETDGSGLGLAITKSLVEAMSGTLGVASSQEGSSFWFELPDAMAGHSTGATPPLSATTSSGEARILLADDLDLNRKLIADMLAIEGYVVDCVVDGTAAVRAASERPYKLVLMDMIMPGMDGLAAARAIRALPAPACDVPIVALTANCAADQLQACLEAGMNATLTKPITFDALSAAVARWLGQRCEAA